MKKLILVLSGMLMLVMLSAQAQAQALPYLFDMSGERFVYLNASHTVRMSLNSFHTSSEIWQLYIRAHTSDNPPYDNLTWSITCTNGESATFDTTSYSTWVNNGYINIPMTYESSSTTIRYNTVPLIAYTVSCDFTLSAWTYNNNTYNTTRTFVEMIPYYSPVEVVNCTGFDDNFGISFTGQATTVVTMMEDAWSIAYTVYSIAVIIFVIVGVPLLVFIIIRWSVYRLTGHKLIERRER